MTSLVRHQDILCVLVHRERNDDLVQSSPASSITMRPTPGAIPAWEVRRRKALYMAGNFFTSPRPSRTSSKAFTMISGSWFHGAAVSSTPLHTRSYWSAVMVRGSDLAPLGLQQHPTSRWGMERIMTEFQLTAFVADRTWGKSTIQQNS